MKTIQMTIDEALLQQVDQTVQSMNTPRSAFIRFGEIPETQFAHSGVVFCKTYNLR